MTEIESLVRPNIVSLKPYRSARQDYLSGTLLDANENAFGSTIALGGLPLNRYPDPSQTQLRRELATLHSTSLENIFTGVGSDEVIELLIKTFCEPLQDAVLIVEPTYGMYRVSASIHGARIVTSLLTDDFQLNVEDVLQKVVDRVKVIFCCSPNNPTGNLLRHADILTMCRDSNAIVVVDEAYMDFAEAPSLIEVVRSYPNLVILRTFSKAWGLAAIRLGYCVADPIVVSYLMKIKSPYNINALTSALAIEALQEPERMKDIVRAIVSERNRLTKSMEQLPFVLNVFPSDSNFLLVRFNNAGVVYRWLTTSGFIVRDRRKEPLLDGCLRITVGTPSQNTLLLHSLRQIKL